VVLNEAEVCGMPQDKARKSNTDTWSTSNGCGTNGRCFKVANPAIHVCGLVRILGRYRYGAGVLTACKNEIWRPSIL